MVEGDFTKNPFLTIERGKLSQMSKSILANFTRHDAKYGRYNSIVDKDNNLYELYCKNNLICALPSTLFILSRVCKTINKEINFNKISNYKWIVDGTPTDCIIFALSHIMKINTLKQSSTFSNNKY